MDVKPFKTHDELIKLLKKRNMQISDEHFAEKFYLTKIITLL